MPYRLTSVRLHNICQHADMTADIRKGLTAVIGRNGSGKTSLLRACVYGLTGLVDGLWGNQQTLQKDGTADVGYVDVSFTDGQDSYNIRRFSTSSIKFPDTVMKNDDVVAVRRRCVDAFMSDVFGMSCQLMFQLCWGRQGELSQLLTSPPAVISTFLAQVFDTKMIEGIRDKIKIQMDRIAWLPDSLPGDLDRAEKELEDVVELVKQKRASLNIIKGRLSAAERELDEAAKELDGCLAEDEKERLAQRCVQAIKDNEAQLANMTKPTVSKDYLYSRSDVSSVRAALWSHTYDVDQFMRSSYTLQTRLTELTQRCREHERSIERLEKGRQFIEQQLGSLSGSPCSCVLCGSSVDVTDGYINKACNLLTGKTPEAYRADCAVDLEELTKGLEGGRKAVEECEAELKLLGDKIQAGQRDKAALQEFDQAFAWYEIETAMEESKTELDRLSRLPVASIGAYERLAELRTAYTDARTQYEQELVDTSKAEAREKHLQEKIMHYSRLVEQRRVNNAARECLTSIRDAMSQNRAQARYLKGRIRVLNRELERHAGVAGMPFNVKLDEEKRSFVYTTQDGYEHPSAHLSGAQKAMASVALQMALFEVVSPGMSLYLIDEPSEALDSGNKRLMAEMFARMNRVLSSSGGTMMIVTRDDELIQSCGSTVEIQD